MRPGLFVTRTPPDASIHLFTLVEMAVPPGAMFYNGGGIIVNDQFAVVRQPMILP
jgi:hypothetical protein